MLANYAYKEFNKIMKNYNSYLEIGSFDGEGIAMLARKYPDKKFYSIEPFIEDGHTNHLTGVKKGESLLSVKDKFKENIKGLSNIIHYEMTTLEFLEKNIDIYADIVFIDGSHNFNDVILDLLLTDNIQPFRIYLDDFNNQDVNKAINIFKFIYNFELLKTDCLDLVYFES